MKKRFALVLLLLLGSAPRALAESPLASLERGIALYEEGELGKAEPLLRAAAADLKEEKPRARAFLFLGLVRASKKDLGATRDSFRAALSDDPLIAIARDRVAPDIVAMFDGVRAELSGEIVVVGAGTGARMTLDGRDAGVYTTPLRVTIGLHSLRVVSGDGAGSFAAEGVVAHVRVPARIAVKYTARLGKVRFPAAWQGASVVSSRGQKGVVRGELELTAGAQRLDVELAGHEPVTAQVTVAADGVIEVSLGIPAPRRSWYARRRTWGYVALGVAGAVAVTGLVLGKLGQNDGDEIQRLRAMGSLRFDQYEALRSSAESKSLAANVLFGVAGAAAIAGIVLAITEPNAEGTRTSWRIVPTGLGASLAVRF